MVGLRADVTESLRYNKLDDPPRFFTAEGGVRDRHRAGLE